MNNRETIMKSHGQKNIRQCHLSKLPDLPASSCKPRVLVILDLNKSKPPSSVAVARLFGT
jgi:hypothetical protein